jgi:hypothetical protein
MKTRFLAVFALLLVASCLYAVSNCPYCGYRIKAQTISCPKCLRLKWPYYPPRTHKAKVIARTGTDAFIRHPSSQNRAFKADKNAGADVRGPIGSWGFLTGLRYLVRFDVEKSFADARVDMESYKPYRVTLRLVIASQNIDQALPIRVYRLSRPFAEGSGLAGIRSKVPDGCTWQSSAPMLPWRLPGGDYYEKPSAAGFMGYNRERVVQIDVTELYKKIFADYAEVGRFNDPGMIIMRDPQVPGYFTYLNIYSFEHLPRRQQVMSPQLFFE